MVAPQDSTFSGTPAENLVLQVEHRPYGPGEVFVFYDGPQLMWLDSGGTRFLAVALPDDAGRWPFLLTELDSSAQQAIENGSLTLRQAFTGAWPVWLLPDYDAQVLCVHRVHDIPEDWLPGDVTLT